MPALHPRPARPVAAHPAATRRPPAVSTDSGAQAIELVMATPVVLLLVLLVVAAGQIALGLLSTHQSAILAARLAATRSDTAVVAELARRDVDVGVHPATGTRRPGDLLTATATRDIEVLGLPAAVLSLEAHASALTEATPSADPVDPAGDPVRPEP